MSLSDLVHINVSLRPTSRLRAIASRVQFHNPPFPVRLAFAGNSLRIDIKVPDRDTGRTIQVVHNTSLCEADIEESVLDDEQIVSIIRDAVVRVFMHEFGECFHVDGRRVEDPHRYERLSVEPPPR